MESLVFDKEICMINCWTGKKIILRAIKSEEAHTLFENSCTLNL